MSESSVASEILTMIKAEANNNPAPLLCTITGNYTNGEYVDIRINNETNILKHIRLIGDNTVGNTGVLVFIDGDLDNMVVISGDVLHKVAKTGDYNDLENKPAWKHISLTNGTLCVNEQLQICQYYIKRGGVDFAANELRTLSTIPSKYQPIDYIVAPVQGDANIIVFITKTSNYVQLKNLSSSSKSDVNVYTSLFWHYGGV